MRYAKCIGLSALIFFSAAHAATENNPINTSDQTQEQKLRQQYEAKHRALEPDTAKETVTGDTAIQDFPVTTDDAPDMADDAASSSDAQD